jgi:hypothetical protein
MQAIGDVITKQIEIKDRIRAGLLTAMQPALEKVGQTLAPVMEALAKPLYKSYRVAIRLYHKEMKLVRAAVTVHPPLSPLSARSCRCVPCVPYVPIAVSRCCELSRLFGSPRCDGCRRCLCAAGHPR